jgi:hypothetical protein
MGSRDSSVGQTAASIQFAIHSVQTGSEAHSAPIRWVPGVKRPGLEADHSPPTSVDLVWIYTSTPPIRLHGSAKQKDRLPFFFAFLSCVVAGFNFVWKSPSHGVKLLLNLQVIKENSVSSMHGEQCMGRPITWTPVDTSSMNDCRFIITLSFPSISQKCTHFQFLLIRSVPSHWLNSKWYLCCICSVIIQ